MSAAAYRIAPPPRAPSLLVRGARAVAIVVACACVGVPSALHALTVFGFDVCERVDAREACMALDVQPLAEAIGIPDEVGRAVMRTSPAISLSMFVVCMLVFFLFPRNTVFLDRDGRALIVRRRRGFGACNQRIPFADVRQVFMEPRMGVLHAVCVVDARGVRHDLTGHRLRRSTALRMTLAIFEEVGTLHLPLRRAPRPPPLRRQKDLMRVWEEMRSRL